MKAPVSQTFEFAAYRHRRYRFLLRPYCLHDLKLSFAQLFQIVFQLSHPMLGYCVMGYTTAYQTCQGEFKIF